MTEHSRGPAPSDDVLVSVSITTFNHRPYIEDAVNGALSQRTPFSYEIIVGDDCSTDGSGELLERLAGRGWSGNVVVEVSTRRLRTREEREADLAEALAFARLNLAAAGA